jgi:TRAP-type C4-dicarboxylate transport system permease small subunit
VRGGRAAFPSPFFLVDANQSIREMTMKKGLFDTVYGLSRFINIIAGISLTFLMLLTIADVILRHFRIPIVGTYELVAFSGAVVIGFSLPMTSWLRQHIFVDFFIIRFSKKVQNIFNVSTRGIVIVLFVLLGWNLFKYSLYLQRSGEVSLTLRIPFWPVAFGVGICCFIQCLVLICDIVKIFGGEYE